jgi:hypothetical protein
VDISAECAFDNVTIGDYPVFIDEKSAAASEFFSARVKGLNRHCRRFDPAHEIGKLILRAGRRCA